MSIIQKKMFQDLKDKDIFKSAKEYSFDYVDAIFSRNVFPTEDALEGLSNFDEELPINNSDANTVLAQLNKYGNLATTATLSGRYFGFVTGSAIPVGIAAKNLASFWDQAPAMNVLSPIGSKLETVVEQWLVKLFGLPESTVAGFVSGTSNANLCALAAVRYNVYEKTTGMSTKKNLDTLLK